jgi:hypothetical protein
MCCWFVAGITVQVRRVRLKPEIQLFETVPGGA